MLRSKIERPPQLLPKISQILTGQTEDNIETQIGKTGLPRPADALSDVRRTVDPAQSGQMPVVEGLRAQRQPVNSSGAPSGNSKSLTIISCIMYDKK